MSWSEGYFVINTYCRRDKIGIIVELVLQVNQMIKDHLLDLAHFLAALYKFLHSIFIFLITNENKAMRFRRKAKIFPGVYLNFSKSGISTTIGVHGASINIGKQGVYLNTGIPGTGIYDREKIGDNSPRLHDFSTPIDTLELEYGAIKSEEAESTTSESLLPLKATLMECYQERIDLKKEISQLKLKLFFSTTLLILSYLIILGFLIKRIKQWRDEHKENLNELIIQLQNCFINIDIELDAKFENKYVELIDKYKDLITCNRIWDITSSVSIDRKVTRSAASKEVKRRLIKFGYGNIDIIKSKYDALHFENANGGDLYIYPAFIVLVDSYKKFGLIDIRDLDFYFHSQRFVEEESVPKDSLIIERTWAKVNKDGSRDKRFKDNYQIPVCQYGEMSLRSKTGLNEAYHFSSYTLSLKFSEKMIEYQKIII